MASFDEIRSKMNAQYGSKKKEEEEQKVSSSGSSKFASVRSEMESKYNPANNVDEEFINTFISDSKKYLDSNESDFGKMGVSTGSSIYNSRKQTAADLRNRSFAISQYLEKNKRAFTPEDYQSIKGYLDAFDRHSGQSQYSFYNSNKFYSQFDSQEEYDAYVAQQKDYEAKKNLNLSDYEKKIAAMEVERQQFVDTTFDWTDNKARKAYEEKLDAYDKEIARMKQYRNQAKHIQEGIELSKVSGSADFDQFSGYVSTKSDSRWDKLIGKEYDDTYEYVNNQNGFRDEYKSKHRAYSSDSPWSDGESTFEEKGYDYLTEDEIAIYNYYYAKDGKDKAQKYLDSIQETLNYRKATSMYENMEDKTLLELAFGVAAGLDQFESGMKNVFNTKDDYIAPSSYQIASGMVREDLEDVGFKLPGWMGGASIGQMGYDTITTSANMAPSIMTSIAANMIAPGSGTVIGSAMMGGSAAGNAYQEMLNLGYSKGQARVYSTLVGASEAGLQYLLGGISQMGGKISGNMLTKMMNGVDNAFLRTAIALGGNMASEGLEEGLQEILTPWFQNLVMNTDETVNWSEVAYSALLGALTAGLMEGPTTIASEVNTYRTGKQLQAADISAARLADIGKTFSADTVAYQLAGKVNENTGAYTMGRLFNEIGATLSEQNVTEITEALVRKGMDRNTARKNAQALAYVVEGGQLSDRQIAMIEANEVLAEVARTTLIDANTTWNQRSQGYNAVLKSLSEEMTAPKASRTNPAQQGDENAPASDTVDTQNENGTESLSEAETVDTSPAKVQSISAIENGQVTVKLEDGTEINVKEADLSVDDGVRIENIASIDGISAMDANFILNTLRTDPNVPAQMAALGAKEAYKYGYYGFSVDYMNTHGAFSYYLTDTQKQAIYETGRSARQRQVDAKQATVAKNATTANKDSNKGKVHFEGDPNSLKGIRKASFTAIEKIANTLGVQIYVFESYINSTGQRVYKDTNGKEVKAPNGWYDPADSSIHIDLNAGAKGEGVMLFTLAHELTHHIRKWSPEKFKILADFLMEEYDKKGVNVDALIREQMTKAERNGREGVTYDIAYEEMVADSMEAMLADGNVMNRLEKLKAKDKDLWLEIKKFVNKWADKIRKAYKGMTPDSDESLIVADMGKAIYRLQELFAEGLVEASENFQSAMETVVEAEAKTVAEEEIITDGAVVTDGEGKKYSIRSMKQDIAEGQMFEDLKTYCNWTQKQVDELRNNLADLVEYMTPYRNILDMNETYGREGRRFSPYKPNSDPLYKISMDFSTLCSKRLLTQYVIENLQLRENRPMSAEEQMAIRDMLNEYRKVEKGLQVACAMCYVEAARLKSPQQINKWLADPGTQMKNYFADKNPEFANFIKEKQADFKESRGYDRYASKKDMKEANKKSGAKDVAELNKIRPRLRSQYQLSTEEAKIVERAKALPNSTYLTAGNLASLSETDPTIYTAYTAFVRTATRSKSLETDEPYYYGDSRRDNGNGIIVSDSFIEAVNRENGMRFSSWSDWRIQHLLDYITAVIDNSVRGAAMHGYTKFGEEVRVLGKTGMMFNMSGVAGTQTGLNEDGSLSFSPTESIDVNEAIQLREEFPDTAGLQCIGVGDDHIFALLRSDIIDYVIPYHVSGLNAGLRAMANIHGWKDYTSTQHAAIDKSIKFEDAVDQEHWHEEPVYSEFFVGYDTGMTGIEAMRASAERYKQMCRERGLKPKFEQFAREDGYWKLLIDRKMVNQKTGKLIQQKAVTPTFDFDTVKSVVDQFVENYDSGLEARALNHIVENWDSIPKRIRDLKKQGSKKAKKASKAVDTLANQTLAAQPTVMQSARDEAIELSDVTTKFSLREEAPPKRTIKAYKVFRVADGKLYPPKIANLTDDESLNKPLSRDPRKGKSRVTATGNDTPVGVWINADVGGIAVDENGEAILNTNGRIKIYDLNGMKGNGDFDQKTTLAFRPGWHLGSIPEAIQFLLGDGTMPDDLVYAECEIAADIDYQAAAMSYGVRPSGKFVHADAGLPAVPVDGYYKYKTNPKTDTHPWFISGAIKVNRIIGDAERRAICAKEGITIAPRYSGKDIEPTDIWPSGQPAVAKDLTPYKKSQKNYENDQLLAKTMEKIKGLSAGNPKLGYIQRELDFNSKGIIDEIEKAKLDVDALRSAYEKHGFNPYYLDTDEEVKYSDRDSDGNQLTKEQSAFFAQSKARDKAGNLLMLYHGTARAGFTTFDPSKGKMGGNWFTTSRADADSYAGNYKKKLFDPNERDDVRSSVGGNFTLGSWMRFDTEADRAEFLKQNPNAETVKTDAEYDELLKKADEARDWDEYDRLEDEQYKNRKELKKLQRAYDRYEWEHSRDATIGELFETPDRFSVSDVLRAWDALDSNNAARDEEYTKEDLIDGLREEHNRLIEDGEDGLTDFPFKARLPVGETGEIVNRVNNRTYAVYVNAVRPFEIDAKQRTLHGANLYPVIEKGLKDSSYDSVIVRNARVGAHEEVGDVVIIKDSTQVKLASNKAPSEGSEIHYSDRDTESVSNRSLLANAFEGLAQNDIEKQKIQEYKGKISLIEAEERKLSELNQKIKDLSFSKGPRDTKAIRDLQFEAKQTSNRISTYDKQLLRLEASKPLQDVLTREKKMAYQRAEKKGKEALEKYREKTMKTQRELINKWQESRKKGIEGRHKTAMRQKVKDVVNELNQYLLRGTKERHVPIELQKAVAEALDAVNMDTVGAEERIAKLKADLLVAKTPEKIQEISRKIDHIQEMGDKMNGRLKKLKDAYDEFVNSDDPLIANSHDEVISNKLQSVIESVGDTPLRDMTLTQLEDVYDMYRMVLTTIRNANKAFKAKKSESISVIANRVMEEVEQVGGKKTHSLAAVEAIKKFDWNNLKPVYAFEHIGSKTFSDVFDNVRAGEDTWAVDIQEAREFYLEKTKKYGFDSWKKDQWFEFTSASGMGFSLNLEQIMSLYAYSKRDQARDHLRRGGIVIDESTEITMKTKLGFKVKFNPTEATAYNITDETLAAIISKLTPEQKQFVDEMQEYLSTTMGNKGNEVSLVMYGVKLFKEKFYFPLKSAQQFMAKAKEQQQGEVKIKNSGFSKETVQKASNPIVLTPFTSVWANHVNEMSMYHSFVLPLEDFYRVYNYKTPTSDRMATESVEMFLQNAYGKGATMYIDQLLKDLNGGARTDLTTGFITKAMNLFKKGAVFASASVVIQQPSAIARATALVDLKYFIGPKVDRKRHKLLWDEVKQYAPVAIIKEMGYFDTNMGKSTQDFLLGKEYESISEKMKALVTDSNFRDEVLSKAPALADEIAWCGIWDAVKRETKARNKGMDVKSEEFLKKVGERFTEVIVKTQVYDSVLSRSANMRSKDTGMKMATAFMAEPTTSINMITDALLKAKRGDKKSCRKAIGSVIAAQILNAFLVSFVYAARDDDEEETYLEKYISNFTAESLYGMNPMTYIPFIKDIVSIVQGYDVERSDMAVISDLWKAWENLDKDSMSTYRKVEGFAGSICQIFGLPVKNIMRDVRSVLQVYQGIVSGQQTTSRGIKYALKEAITGKATPNTQQLYESRLAGDEAHEARVEARYDDEDSANAAVRQVIKAKFMAGEIDTATALKYMVLYTGMDGVEAHWLMNAWEHKLATGSDDGYSKYNDFYEAVRTGKNLTAVIQEYSDNGVTKSTMSSQITSHFKPQYIEMSAAQRANLKGYLINAMELCGVERDEAQKRLERWDFEAEYGFDYSDRKSAYLDGKVSAEKLKDILIDVKGYSEEDAEAQIKVYDYQGLGYEGVTIDAIQDYEQFCEDAGVSMSMYLQIRKFSNETKNDVDENGKTIYYSAVKKVVAEIDKLPIEAEQKTAIALSFWKESTVKKYKTW